MQDEAEHTTTSLGAPSKTIDDSKKSQTEEFWRELIVTASGFKRMFLYVPKAFWIVVGWLLLIVKLVAVSHGDLTTMDALLNSGSVLGMIPPLLYQCAGIAALMMSFFIGTNVTRNVLRQEHVTFIVLLSQFILLLVASIFMPFDVVGTVAALNVLVLIIRHNRSGRLSNAADFTSDQEVITTGSPQPVQPVSLPEHTISVFGVSASIKFARLTEKQRKKRRRIKVYITSAFTVIFLLGAPTFLFANDIFWDYPQRIITVNKTVEIGYLIKSDDNALVVMREDDRSIVLIGNNSIASRESCKPDSRIPLRSGLSQIINGLYGYDQKPAYPKC